MLPYFVDGYGNPHSRTHLYGWEAEGAIEGRAALSPGGYQVGYVCDQNSTYGLHSLPGGVRLDTWTPYRLSAVECVFTAGCHCRGVSLDWLHGTGTYWLPSSELCFDLQK
jgi:hypothetical protein